MSVLSLIKGWIYKLIVRSHILYYLLPYLQDLILKSVSDIKDSNHKVADAKGRTLTYQEYEHRIYPLFGLDRIKTVPDIAIRENDVIICGYPKSGCHWSFEIVNMLATSEAQLSKYGKLWSGMIDILPDIILDSLPSPRVLNTHYRFEHLPRQVKEKRNKIIFTIRNPKDTVVSFYNHSLVVPMYNYDGDFDDYFRLFMDGRVDYRSYFDYNLSWDEHIKNPTTNPILLLSYEELKLDPVKSVKKIAQFLEIKITESFAQEITEATNINAMRKISSDDPIASKLFRKGTVGDWKNWLSDEQSAEIDKVWQEKMTGLTYQPIYDEI